jgi:hypothetical protein
MFNTLANVYKTDKLMSEWRSAASRDRIPNKWLATATTCEITNNKPAAKAGSDR